MVRFAPDRLASDSTLDTRRPTMSRQAKTRIPKGTVFVQAGRLLAVVQTHGTDAAAPVIVEELASSPPALRGQFAMWSVEGVTRAMRVRR
jgi:hypothetical protein